MTRKWSTRRWRAGWIVGFFLLLVQAGCSFDARSSATRDCDEQTACPRGEICIEGLCQPTESAGDATINPGDAGTPDASEADARPDAAVPSDTGHTDTRIEPDVAPPDDAGTPDDAGFPEDTDPAGCTDGETRSCGIDTGECVPGVETCAGGVWGECEGGQGPVDELCDGLDNDCDGDVDNDPTGVGESCDTLDPGVCGDGVRACDDGQWVCSPTQSSSAEVCDGLDNDCDGEVDEGVAAVGQACDTGEAGICNAGENRCQFGQLVCARTQGPLDEICDGEDDNCDGQVDESFPEQGDACQTGQPGICADGVKVCTSGAIACDPIEGPSAEVCDGLDNDCDGLVDEASNGAVLSQACGAQTCPGRGVSYCLSGQWSTCSTDSLEVCDAGDTNCDGQTDNQSACLQACPGGGVATGTLDCATGLCKTPREICGDGVDNNCDGQVDESCQSSPNFEGMLYIPGGPFWMGSQATDWSAQADEQPQHLVELDAFYIDRTEVSRQDYVNCINAGACSVTGFNCPYQGAGSTRDWRDKPAGCMSYGRAESYCQWVGKRLPTAAEWEKVSRGPYPRTNLFPWGDAVDPTKAVVGCPDGLNDCVVKVESYPGGASYYGALHMAGNVAEWVTDYYDPDFYTAAYTVSPEQTADAGYGHAVRGGSYDQALQYARSSNRAAETFPTVDDDAIGFRCAADAP